MQIIPIPKKELTMENKDSIHGEVLEIRHELRESCKYLRSALNWAASYFSFFKSIVLSRTMAEELDIPLRRVEKEYLNILAEIEGVEKSVLTRIDRLLKELGEDF